jgi:hypothetical protein
MGDGIIEDLQNTVERLHGTVVELCRRAGHDWQPRAKYDYCAREERAARDQASHRVRGVPHMEVRGRR